MKDRDKTTGKIKINGFSAKVAGKDVVIFEDIVASAGTACDLAALLKEKGARSVTLFATSGLFTIDPKKGEGLTAAVDRVNTSKLDAVFITDTVNHQLTDPRLQRAIDRSPVIHTVKTAPYLASILRALHMDATESNGSDLNSVSAILRGAHPDLTAPGQTIAAPVPLKPTNPLRQLRHKALA